MAEEGRDTAPLVNETNEEVVAFGDENVPGALSEPTDPAANETQPTQSDADNPSIIQMFKQLSWRKRLTFITAAFVNFTATCCFSIMAPFLPLEAENKGIDSTTVGIIFASFQLMNFFGSIIFGRYLTTIGARFLYITGILLAASCSVLFGILEWCPPGMTFAVTAIACRCVEAIGCSMCQTASTAIVANEFPERVATIIGLLESIGGLGFMIGPTIGGALYDLGGFFLPFVAVGAVLFVIGLIASCTLPKTAVVVDKDRNKLFWTFVKVPAVMVCGVCILVCATLMTCLDPILSNQLAAVDPELAKSQTLIGLVFLVMPALYALLSPLVGYLADTFKHQLPLLAMGNAGFILALFLIGPCPLLPLPQKLWLIILALVLLGFFCAFCFMPAFAVIQKGCAEAGLINDLDLFGLMAGFFGFAYNLGAFAGPLLGGILVQQFGFAWATSMMSAIPVLNLTILLAFAITRYRKSNQISTVVDNIQQ